MPAIKIKTRKVAPKKVSLPAETLARMIDLTVYAMGEQKRYALHGVYVQCRDRALDMVATDGRRLSFCATKLQATECNGVIVPTNMMKDIRKMCRSKRKGDITLFFQEKELCVSCGETSLSSPLIEGIFPKYLQLFSNEEEVPVHKETFRCQPLLAILKEGISFWKNGQRHINRWQQSEFPVIALNVTSKGCTVKYVIIPTHGEPTESKEMSLETVDHCLLDEREPFLRYCNIRYLYDVVHSLLTPMVSVCFYRRPSAPLVIQEEIGEISYKGLIMPTSVRE